ncbi:MAG: hypothetical protein AAGL68_06560 [Pseudomonadota bacterium]
MTTIAFMACETTLPGAGARREDAFEHDRMVAAIEPALAGHGIAMKVVDWEADLATFDNIPLAMLGTAWNYQDKHAAYLAKLDALEERGIQLCNSAGIVRWNSVKTYLRELEEAGARTIPTIWLEDVGADVVMAAMDEFGCDRLVVKRQVGAGAEGQVMFARDDMPAADWRYGHAAMLQPFLPAIQSEGEFSFLFIDGEFSHSLCKRAASGDYRIQSLYGGMEIEFTPSEQDQAQAEAVIAVLPFDAPLYARIDMVRRQDGKLLLMEAELVEPYLYPEQGPELGQRIASAIAKRLSQT